MSKNEDIAEAMELLEEVSQDKKMRRLAELRQKAIWDEASAKESAIKYGLQEGIKEGMKKGMEEGTKAAKIEIVKNMLAKNVDVSTISDFTGLSVEEIEKLKV